MKRYRLAQKKCCPLLSARSALLVLLWQYLVYLHFRFLRYCAVAFDSSGSDAVQAVAYGLFFIALCCGLLAGVWFSRYKVIIIGIVLCFMSWTTTGVSIIINEVADARTCCDCMVLIGYGIAYLLEGAGFALFQTNILQYNIDQLVGASADQLSTLIYWSAAAVPIIGVFLFKQCLIKNDWFIILVFITAGIGVSLILVTHSLFQHKLENISLIKNPIKLIARVLNYARKHKYPENRSALTYWERETPSRLDLGKEKYGGPFTEEEVEDVKTFFRMLPLFIAVVGHACAEDFYNEIKEHGQHNLSFTQCLISTRYAFSATAVIVFLVHFFLIEVFFRKCILRMLSRIIAGLALALIVMVTKAIIFGLIPVDPRSNTPFTNSVLLVPQILSGLEFVLIYPASLEFTIAQAPVQMRGVMIGVWYGSLGIGYAINVYTKLPFKCGNEFLCTSYYYYLTKSVILLLILIVFVILAKRYKYRVRENEVNIHQIAEDQYVRYMDQEEEHEIQEMQDVDNFIIN